MLLKVSVCLTKAPTSQASTVHLKPGGRAIQTTQVLPSLLKEGKKRLIRLWPAE